MAGDLGRAGSAVLDGAAPLALADDFWFLAHDTVTGGLRLHEQARDTGLAACLLGELWLSGWVTVEAGMVGAVDRRPAAPADLNVQPPAPTLVEGVWAQIVHEPWRHSIRTWLSVLGLDVNQRVIDRMAAAGHLHVQRSRRSVRAEPASWNTAGLPAARLRTYLERQRKLLAQDAALLALIEATGLSGPVFDGVSDQARDYHAQLLGHIAHQGPVIAGLVAQTRAAIASAALTRGHG